MAKTYNRLNIEINQEITDIITGVQNDTLTRFLDVTLFNNGVPVNLQQHKARIYIVKPDKTEIFNDGQITNATGGRVQFELTTQALAVCGCVNAQIIIFDNAENEILSTEIFKIFVTESLKNENSIESSNEYGALVVLFQKIYESLQLIEKIDRTTTDIKNNGAKENTNQTIKNNTNRILQHLQNSGGGGAVKSVQRGVATLPIGYSSYTNTISLSYVNVNKCMVILNGQINGVAGGGQILNFEPYVESLSSSQLRIAYRNIDGHSGGTTYLYTSWQIIEFY